MNKKNISYLLTILVAFMAMSLVGCSDDDAAQQGDLYGYVQFKLYKSESAEGQGAVSRAVEKLDRLSSAHKMKIVLQGSNSTITQTILLNSYNTETAEYGLRSDKMKLVAGDYKAIGFTLYNNKEEELLSADIENCNFTIVAGGLVTESLSVPVAGRGKVSFKIVKNIAPLTRATEDDEVFPFGNIQSVDVTVQNQFTLEKTTFSNLPTKYVEDFKNDAAPGHNTETSYLECDTVLWLPQVHTKCTASPPIPIKRVRNSLARCITPPTLHSM